MKKLNIGIATFEQMRDRSIAIAKGKYKPKRSEPKIWFTSMQSFARVLSEENQELLALIAKQEPESYRELEELTGRKVSNLSRTLKKMEAYGLVYLKKGKHGRIKPSFPYSGVRVDLPIVDMTREKQTAA